MHWLGVVHSLKSSTFGRAFSLVSPATIDLVGARVSYRQDGRSGSVVFSKGARSFEMYYEFGGGDVVASIEVPTAELWQAITGFPTEKRRAILEFIGRTVARDQVSQGRGRFEVHDDHILIMSGTAQGHT